MKKCSYCKVEKPFESFKKRSSRKSGYQSQCKNCVKLNYTPTAERAKHYQKTWIARHPEKRREIKRNWWNKNSNEINANRRKKRIENPGNLKELETIAKQKRRARKKNNGHSPYTMSDIFSAYGTNCHICDTPVDLKAPRKVGISGWELGLHIDHVVPLSKGGPDSLENVKPSHGICNLKKNSMA